MLVLVLASLTSSTGVGDFQAASECGRAAREGRSRTGRALLARRWFHQGHYRTLRHRRRQRSLICSRKTPLRSWLP